MRINFDVDTEKDFMNETGALYVPGAELIKPNLKSLTSDAEKQKIPILGSIDVHFGTPEYAHREGELQIHGGPFDYHTMHGTKGAEKIKETMILYSDCWPDVPAQDTGIYVPHRLDNTVNRNKLITNASQILNPLDHRQGIFFEKQSYDVFTNPSLEVFLDILGVTEAVVYGVATDYCVKAAVLGMQKRGIQCYVVDDAIAGVGPETTKSALEEMAEAGAKFVKTEEVIK